MQWKERWRAVSARIEGLVRAGELMASMLKNSSSDPYQVVGKSLMPELGAIVRQLHNFETEYSSSLPDAAKETLKRFLDQKWEDKCAGNSVGDIKSIVPLAAFRSEFEYLLRDMELETRNLTELAFEHLQRLIEVDPEVQQKWEIAFNKRENHCERLGAVHLLSHGIWAFKVSGIGAATDLVFGVPIERDIERVRGAATALVLTEWKLVKDKADLYSKAAEARRQTSSYAAGLLGDLELQGSRYIILVTTEKILAPPDAEDNGVTFRHITIPVAPSSPSRQARKG